MPKKSILISSGSAKRAAVPNNAFTYDTDTQYVSIDNLSSSQFVLTGAVSGVLISSGGVITNYNAQDNSGSYLVSDGTKWAVGSAGNASIGPVSGTLSGSYPNPKFVDISYVDTGSLPVARGGFSGSSYNILTSIPSGSLILASGTGSLTVVSTASYSSTGDAWVLASVSGTSVWAAVTASAPAMDANVQFFTCSSPTVTTTGSWVKQNPNHQWARVMLQGGGGGGGGYNGIAGTYYTSGGGAGGFTDIVVYIGDINSARVTVGAGTSGSSIPNNIRAATAASSSFSASNIFVSAGGGQGGIATPTQPSATGGTGGIGLTYSGGDGSSQLVAAAAAVGSSGGGSRGVWTAPTASLYMNNITNPSTLAPTPTPGTASINIYGYNIPVGFATGGNGRGDSTNAPGGNGVFGSGGGGGAGLGGSLCVGGNGGDGWVVVVSY